MKTPKLSDLVKTLDDPEIIKQLREHGIRVRRDVPLIRKTFEVQEQVLKQFLSIAQAKKIKIKDAIDEALRDWIKKQAED